MANGSQYRLYLQRAASWLILGAVTLELCARTEDAVRHSAPFWGVYDNESIYMASPIGKRGIPNASYLKWKLNDKGYRGPALRNGTYRIVCLGASETFGMYESEGGEWPRRLETELNRFAVGRPFEVVNAAYPGMRIANNLRQVDNIIGELHPAMVLIYPSYAGYIDPPAPGAAPAQPQRRRFELRIASRFDTLLKRTLPAEVQDAARTLELWRADRHQRPLDRVPDTSITRFEEDLSNLIVRYHERGVQVVVITHATRFGDAVRPEDRPYLRAWRRFYPGVAEDGFLDMEKRMREATLRACAHQSAAVIDAAKAIPPGGANFGDFVHFTDRGAQAFASMVARNLRGRIETAPSPAMRAALIR
jgi:hypothetical protein